MKPLLTPLGGGGQPRDGQLTAQLPRRTITLAARFLPWAQGPGVRLGWWPALVGLGFVVAVVAQALLLAKADVPVTPVVGASLLASALGLLGAKAYFLILHRRHPGELRTSGACIQGFLLVAFGVLAGAAVWLRLPAGTVLNASTPGLFFGMAIGRPGCLAAGCCAGRPTTSRWGVWSSDRRLAIRRVPVQLLEAVIALMLGVVTLILLLAGRPGLPGAVFVAALAGYIGVRQLLFPLRAQPRTPLGRTTTLVVAALTLAAAVAAAAIGG